MNQNKKTKTDLSEIGEFGVIKKLTESFEIKNTSTIKGIGDDAALLDYAGKQMVVTTDLLVEGIHFDLAYTPLKHLGYKSVIVNLSDVYAMNAVPKQITMSVAVSNRFPFEALQELYEGIKIACNEYGVDLIGGDTSSSVTGMLISVTAMGEADKAKVAYRNGAKVNDLICVTGNLGGAYMGLQLLEREKEIFKATQSQPELQGYDYVLQRQLKPEARRDIVTFFNENNIKPNAMIDISDGLSSEILHICNQSATGCRIFEEKIPVHAQTKELANELNLEPLFCALNGGEDYELLFTVPGNYFDIIKTNPDISVIGHITEMQNGMNLILRDGTETPVIAQGWNAMDDKK